MGQKMGRPDRRHSIGSGGCYPVGGTGARTTCAVPSGNVTVQVTVFPARLVFWPYDLTTIVGPPVGVKVINSWTMCWPSIHRLA
jgi:hypothetical protein